MPFDVFISYSSKDKTTADAACASLEAAGIRCWMAPRDIRGGLEYAEVIIEGIDACRIMVLIFSANSNASPQVHREIERAVSKGLTIIPFRIEDIAPTKAMEYYLGSIHWLDALTPPLTAHLAALVGQVRANLAVYPAAVRQTQTSARRAFGASYTTQERPRASAINTLTQLILVATVVALSVVVFLIWRSTSGTLPVTPPDRPPVAKNIPAEPPQQPTVPQRSAPPFSVTRTAAFGGDGGVAFDEQDLNENYLPVSSVSVLVNLNPGDQTQRVIGGLQVRWGDKTGPAHGGKGPFPQPVTGATFMANEKIGRVDINWGPYHYKTSDNVPPQWVAGLQIWTDQRVYAFGDVKFGQTSRCMLADKEILLGFFGRAGSFIDQLGCIIGKPK